MTSDFKVPYCSDKIGSLLPCKTHIRIYCYKTLTGVDITEDLKCGYQNCKRGKEHLKIFSHIVLQGMHFKVAAKTKHRLTLKNASFMPMPESWLLCRHFKLMFPSEKPGFCLIHHLLHCFQTSNQSRNPIPSCDQQLTFVHDNLWKKQSIMFPFYMAFSK